MIHGNKKGILKAQSSNVPMKIILAWQQLIVNIVLCLAGTCFNHSLHLHQPIELLGGPTRLPEPPPLHPALLPLQRHTGQTEPAQYSPVCLAATLSWPEQTWQQTDMTWCIGPLFTSVNTGRGLLSAALSQSSEQQICHYLTVQMKGGDHQQHRH